MKTKRISAVIFYFLLFTFPGLSSAGPSLIISEVLFNPIGSDAQREFIEIFNPNGVALDLSGYSIRDDLGSGSPFFFPFGAQILPGETLIIARNLTGFESFFGFSPDFGGFTMGLNNGGDFVQLKDNTGTVIDLVAWNNAIAGWGITAAEGEALKRQSLAVGPASWLGGQTPNPGAPNGLGVVPEPNSLILLAFGILGLRVLRRKKQKLH